MSSGRLSEISRMMLPRNRDASPLAFRRAQDQIGRAHRGGDIDNGVATESLTA